jgi:hypothetical protein
MAPRTDVSEQKMTAIIKDVGIVDDLDHFVHSAPQP